MWQVSTLSLNQIMLKANHRLTQDIAHMYGILHCNHMHYPYRLTTSSKVILDINQIPIALQIKTSLTIGTGIGCPTLCKCVRGQYPG